MKKYKKLLIDSLQEITLIKESISCFSRPFDLMCYRSLPEALMAIKGELPDLILIGSGMVLTQDSDLFPHIGSIPTVILCEGEGFNILLKEELRNILFLSRSFDFERVPQMLKTAYQFMQPCREGTQCTPLNKGRTRKKTLQAETTKKKPLTQMVNEAIEKYLEDLEEKKKGE